MSGITYSAEMADGIAALAWQVPIHIWVTYPRWSRATMAEIVKGKQIIEYHQMQHREKKSNVPG